MSVLKARVDSAGSITRVSTVNDRQTVLDTRERRTTVINKVNPYLQQKRRSQMVETCARRAGRCQPWRVERLSLEKRIYSAMSKFTEEPRFKASYSYTHEQYEIFCPACDVYFHNFNDYQNHEIIQSIILPYKTLIAEYNAEMERNAEKSDKVETAGSGMRSKSRKSQQKLFPVEPYLLSPIKRFYNEEAMWEQLKVQRSRAAKIRKKAKLEKTLRMSKRNMLRRATIKISQENHLMARSSLPSRKSTMAPVELPERISLQAKMRSTVGNSTNVESAERKNLRESVLDCTTSKRLTLQQTAKLAAFAEKREI